MNRQYNNLYGIVAMLASMAGIITNDTMVKLASSDLPTGEIIFMRGAMASAFMLVFVIANGSLSGIRAVFNRAVVVRTLAEICATGFYLTALFRMPIANATAILQVLPLAITGAAAIFLRERVGWRRWAAVWLGFIGVLIIVRPGYAGFNKFSLFVFAAVIFITLRDLATRNIPHRYNSATITLITSCAVTLFGLSMWSIEEWVVPTWQTFSLLAGASLFLLIGYFGAIVSMRLGEMSVVAPFRYSIVIWSLIYGFLIWNERPDAPMLAGTGLIVVAGLYGFFREQRVPPKA